MFTRVGVVVVDSILEVDDGGDCVVVVIAAVVVVTIGVVDGSAVSTKTGVVLERAVIVAFGCWLEDVLVC